MVMAASVANIVWVNLRLRKGMLQDKSLMTQRTTRSGITRGRILAAVMCWTVHIHWGKGCMRRDMT
jgi:hypothetical protein